MNDVQMAILEAPHLPKSTPATANRLFVRAGAMVMLLAAVIYFAGNGRIPLTDRDEGWYAQISRTMVQSGDWVVPRFRNQVFQGKPVFAFWCQALSMKIFGQTVFAARVPSAVFGLATLGLVWWAVSRFVGARRAAWTVFVLATSALYAGLSKLAMMDAELLLWITLAQLCLAAHYRGRTSLWISMLLWAAVALAMLTKGPVVIGVLGGTALALALLDVGRYFFSFAAWRRATRWWWSTRPWLALLILPAILGPWALLMGQRSPGFMHATLFQFMLGPIFGKPLESRPLMPGFYVAVIWPSFWPWTLLLPLALWQAWKNRRLAPVRMCLAAFAGPFVVNELVKQKLPHYLLPLFPPLAFLAADAIVRILRHPAALSRSGGWKVSVIAWTVVGVLAGAMPWILTLPQFHVAGLPYAAMSAFTLTSAISAVLIGALLLNGRLRAGLLLVGASIAGVYLLAWIFVLPQCTPLRASQRAADAIWQAGFRPGDPVALIGYEEPTITFHLDGAGAYCPCNLQSGSPPQVWPKWVVTSGGVWAQTPDERRRLFRVLGIYGSFSFGSASGNQDIVVLEKLP